MFMGLVLGLTSAYSVNTKYGDLSTDVQCKVLKTDESGCLLDVSVSGFEKKEFDAAQYTKGSLELFSILSIGEYAYTGEIGKPKLPMITQVMDVPHGAEIKLELLESDFEEIDLPSIDIYTRIAPALVSVPKKPEARVDFVLDNEIYTNNAYYPDKILGIMESDDLARGHRLATLQIFPIQYNPLKNKIRFYRNIRLRVVFVGGNPVLTRQSIMKNYSPLWEDFIKKMVINYPDYLKDPPVLPVYYDIFYHNAFSSAAESLAFWKSKKGFKVRKWNAAGWSANAIDDTIEAQVPIATFVVVIGDPNSTTPLPASGTGSASGDQTDLYYAEINGSGYLPDLFNARISVLDSNQAKTVVRKALRYEHADFGTAGTAWLKKAFFIAGYDPYGMQTVGMATNWYCRNLLIPYGYTVDTIVCSSGEQETRVVNAINSGYAWCVYTAHGGQTEWSVGYYGNFSVTELTNLTTNLDMYPMPCGHCCLTGDYQYGTNCFGETWDRLDGKGGICYYGSVPSTYWDEDDWLQRRYFDAIYADSVQGNLYETGRFTQWGLYWIQNHTATSLKRYYFEAYHIFNDPALDFWTEEPDDMIVDHLPIAAPGSGNFDITVKDDDGTTPLENALVCCWVPNQNPEMHVSEYTDAAGEVTLSISPTTPGDTMFVTVTKHNYTPYEGYVLITGASGPYIVMGAMTVDDNGGDGQVNPDEDINLSMWAKNIGVAPALGVYGLLLESDPYVTIHAASSWFGTIPQDDSAFSNTDFEFSVDSTCPDEHIIQFTLLFHDFYDSVWTAYPACTVYSNVGVGEYGDIVLPTKTMLQTVCPNPFSTVTDIKYEISNPTSVDLTIYDVNGRVVKTCAHKEPHNPGYYTKHWNGLDDKGYPVAHGIYFIRFRTSDLIKIEKIILLK
jgi:hypothetical protein